MSLHVIVCLLGFWGREKMGCHNEIDIKMEGSGAQSANRNYIINLKALLMGYDTSSFISPFLVMTWIGEPLYI